jgi:hypothetical protein
MHDLSDRPNEIIVRMPKISAVAEEERTGVPSLPLANFNNAKYVHLHKQDHKNES